MEKIIQSGWLRPLGSSFARGKILTHNVHPEGFDVERVRFLDAGRFSATAVYGQILSVVGGRSQLTLDAEPLQVGRGVHVYVPPNVPVVFDAEQGTDLVRVSHPSPEHARGRKVLLRDEEFLAACSMGTSALRWILTPQYLSRRVFLHHDKTLVSRTGNPVSWFHTTMFDVSGLPTNQEGESVFKMSYNSRTEFNVVYEVEGIARVRFARHPYADAVHGGVHTQEWDAWQALDGDTTYHLNEPAGGPEEEWRDDLGTGLRRPHRNKHEVYASDGHVSLFCLFDPAATGVERHRPGEYSDYEPVADVIGTPEYEAHQRECVRFDEMLDRLSFAKAKGELEAHKETPLGLLYESGCRAQAAIEQALSDRLAEEGEGRERIVARWLTGAGGGGREGT